MSKLEVNAIEPQSGNTVTLGASGDTITIPAGATISNSGTAAGFGPTGAVSWNTTKITANPNPAVTGVGYFCDTSTAAFTVTLPATPAAGAVVGIADYANTFATNNLTVGRNGSNIGGVAANATLSTNGLSVTFVYVDATQGWIVTDSGNRSDLPTPQFIVATGGTILTCGNFKTHVFTGPGTFIVSCAGNPLGSTTVEYLVVAGGGSGGRYTSAGGGAGGYRQNYPSPTTAGLPVTATSFPITVGAGGASVGPAGESAFSPTAVLNGNRGSSSIFSTITSTGGGGGGGCFGVVGPTFPTVGPGGSGGGGARGSPGTGGTGNTPPVSPSQGNNGGGSAGVCSAGGGGGGAGAVGTAGTASPRSGGVGGTGSPIATTFFGPTSPSYGTPGPAPGRYFAGGGAGGLYDATSGPVISGGAGGGGPAFGASACGPGASKAGTAGTVNTGGGGGSCATSAGYNNAPGAGGSGVVVIRYKFQ